MNKMSTTQETSFVSHGLRCAATLYLPASAGKFPTVIMAHGFGGERSFGLTPFVERFVDRGLAVFVFDYRSFGGSQGYPRNHISPRRHVADWKSALDHVRSLPAVDAERIGLWGTSFSGGHALVTAARNPGVRALVMQVPFPDGLAVALKYSFRYMVKATVHGLRDVVHSAISSRPHTVPIVGAPEDFALLNTPDCEAGIRSLLPEDGAFLNEAPARIALTLPLYRPVIYAPRVRCPALVVYTENDSLIPVEAVHRLIDALPQAESMPLDCGHFDVYTGALFERVAATEADFLARALGLEDQTRQTNDEGVAHGI